METIYEGWLIFKKASFAGVTPSKDEVEEARIAYYAGAWACLELQSKPPADELEMKQLLASLIVEVSDYYEQCKGLN